MPRTSIPVAVTLLLAIPAPIRSTAASPGPVLPPHPTDSATAGVKRLGRVVGFHLASSPANGARYVSNPGVWFAALTPKVYDVTTRTTRSPRFLKRLGKRYYSARLVYYDAAKGYAGLWITKRVGPAPSPNVCACGTPYRTIPGTGRRFCPRCHKVAGFSFRVPKNLETHYAHVSLRTQRILWSIKVGSRHVYPLLADSAGTGLMTYRVIRRKEGHATSQRVILRRIAFGKRRVDWTYTVSLPRRTGLAFASLGHASLMASADLAKVFIREYDERNRKHPNGYLISPPSQGVVVDVASSTHVSMNVPVTSYGAVFGPRNRSLYISSHQRGKVYRYDTRTGRLLRTSAYVGHGAFHVLLSGHGRYLYCIHLRGIQVLEPTTLGRVASIPLSELFPGHHKLLGVERVVSLRSGDFLMGILQRHRRSGTSSSRAGSGFVHFKALE